MSQDIVRHDDKQPESYRNRIPVLAPPVDIYENENEILMLADVPGVKDDGISITLEKNELTLHAKRMIDDQPGTPLSRDFAYGDYYRSFVVPQGIDSEKVEAKLKDGVLHVHLPKSEGIKPRKIRVKTD